MVNTTENMTPNVKDPPSWRDEMSYEEYKKEIEVWQLLKSATDLEEGPLIFRQLTGKAKAAAHELSVAEIGAKDGLNKTTAILQLVNINRNQNQ